MKIALNPNLFPPADKNGNISLMDPTLNVISIVASIGFTAFAIYLIIKWSRDWNIQFKTTE